MAPRGRPPAEHAFVHGVWLHKTTGEPLDPEAHAERVRAKKIACMRSLYWERGGRQKRLARYVRKRKPKPAQATLECTLACAGRLSDHPPRGADPSGLAPGDERVHFRQPVAPGERHLNST